MTVESKQLLKTQTVSLRGVYVWDVNSTVTKHSDYFVWQDTLERVTRCWDDTSWQEVTGFSSGGRTPDFLVRKFLSFPFDQSVIADQEVRGSTPEAKTCHNFGPVSGITSLMCSWSMYLWPWYGQVHQVRLGVVVQVWRSRNQTSCPLPVPHPVNLHFRVRAVQTILTPGLETNKSMLQPHINFVRHGLKVMTGFSSGGQTPDFLVRKFLSFPLDQSVIRSDETLVKWEA